MLYKIKQESFYWHHNKVQLQCLSVTYHQSSQHGKSCSEIIPGDGQLFTDTGELQYQYKEGDAEAEAPGEHAPCPECVGAVTYTGHQAEGDTGGNQLKYPYDA